MKKLDTDFVKTVLEQLYGKYPLRYIAMALGVKDAAIYYYAKKLRLHTMGRKTTKIYDQNMKEILIKKVKDEIKKLKNK